MKVLITGATGFVGTRLAEKLVLGGRHEVKGMVHSLASSWRLARLRCELIQGDVTDRPSLIRAIQDCDAVVHCVNSGIERGAALRRFTALAARQVAEVAAEHGVSRLVYLSSFVVYGGRRGQRLIESMPLEYTGDPYADGKIDSERTLSALAESRGLPYTILRPAIIYGPYSWAWTVRPLEVIRSGRAVLVGAGDSPANTVYIDNLVDAILLCLESEAAVGGAFNITDNDGLTWRQLFEAYASMLDETPRAAGTSAASAASLLGQLKTLPADVRTLITSQEFRSFAQKGLQQPSILALARKAVQLAPPAAVRKAASTYRSLALGVSPPQGPSAPAIDNDLAALQTANCRLDVSKARAVLGYEPAISFSTAMQLTRQWALHAGLLACNEDAAAGGA